MPLENMYEIINNPLMLKKYRDVDVYTFSNDAYQLVKPKGTVFNFENLSREGHPLRLYIRFEDRIRHIRGKQQELNRDLKESLKVDLPKSRKIIVDLVEVSLSEPRAEVLIELKETIDVIVGEYLENEAVIEQLTYISAHDHSTQLHLTNVMLFCLRYAHYEKFSAPDMKILGLAGLLHDIGKVEIPDYILQAPRKLTTEEFNQIQSHPLSSFKILEQCNVDRKVQYAALQHHERLDGTGYPNGKKGSEILEYSKILAVIDVFEALTTFRPYKDPFHPLKALKIIKDEVANNKLDAQIFEKFAYCIVGITS